MYADSDSSICRAGYEKQQRPACTPLEQSGLPESLVGKLCMTCQKLHAKQLEASRRTLSERHAFGAKQSRRNDGRRLVTLLEGTHHRVLRGPRIG